MLPVAHREPLRSRLRRRALSVPGILLASLLTLLTLPVTLPLAVVVDLFRKRRWPTLRFMLMFAAFMGWELRAVTLALGLWIAGGFGRARGSERYVQWHYNQQRSWAVGLFGILRRLYGVAIEFDGPEPGDDGPFILLPRHVSTGDTLLPIVIYSDQQRLRPRYVMKRELRWEPALDLFGSRMPNHFVERGGDNTAAEVASIVRLLEDLRPTDFIVFYPEGTRFTPKKQARIREKLAQRDDPRALARAEALTHTLPPRPAGTLALLRANPGVDVVFCGHVGFEAVTELRHLFLGAMIDRTLRVKLWRIPYADIPTDPEVLEDWLHERWADIDTWVAQNLAGSGADSRADEVP